MNLPEWCQPEATLPPEPHEVSIQKIWLAGDPEPPLMSTTEADRKVFSVDGTWVPTQVWFSLSRLEPLLKVHVMGEGEVKLQIHRSVDENTTWEEARAWMRAVYELSKK